VVIDTANPNRVYVAALGNIYGPSPDRGVYRSLDRGMSWQKILSNTRLFGQRRRGRSSHRS
jgi:hypothetical protein